MTLRFVILLALGGSAWGQAIPLADPAEVARLYRHLLPQIEKIGIFDNHAHPGFADDPDVDAMASPPGSSALRTRADNPELVAAAKDLFGYPYADFNPEHAAWLIEKKQGFKKAGPAYFDGILDKLGISESVANRVSMPGYLDPKRFRWVCFADSFLFPFDNRDLIAVNGDQQVYIPLQEKKLQRELAAAGASGLPGSLDEYLAFVTRTLEANKRNGAIGVKFEAAYFRSLYFSDPPKELAAKIYATYHTGGRASARDYTNFQDYVFRHIVRESGRLGLSVHFHTCVGIGDYFSLQNGNILNLENVLRDPRYSNVNFVMIHGGYPRDREAIWLAARKNVYIDSSFTELVLYPSQFKDVLRQWLEVFPEKVVFGSDAFPFNDALGAEECYWLAVKSARSALAAALAEMIALHEIDETRALAMAHAYLHDTASALYPKPQ
jgi:predicted TIM-barrel fold metal-dependent hydrolase